MLPRTLGTNLLLHLKVILGTPTSCTLLCDFVSLNVWSRPGLALLSLWPLIAFTKSTLMRLLYVSVPILLDIYLVVSPYSLYTGFLIHLLTCSGSQSNSTGGQTLWGWPWGRPGRRRVRSWGRLLEGLYSCFSCLQLLFHWLKRQ